MKNLILTLTIAISVFTVSCAKEKLVATTPTDKDTGLVDPTQPTFDELLNVTGGVAPLDVSTSIFENFLKQPTFNLQDIKVNLDMVQNDDGTFSGQAYIMFNNNGKDTYYRLESGDKKASYYNKWINDYKQFHAVFDDFNAGMIVVTIDKVYDFGDGLDHADLADGSVYYYNYDKSRWLGQEPDDHPHHFNSDAYCWNTRGGVYSCHPWSSPEQAEIQVSPDTHIKLLGRFTGLSLSKSLTPYDETTGDRFDRGSGDTTDGEFERDGGVSVERSYNRNYNETTSVEYTR